MLTDFETKSVTALVTDATKPTTYAGRVDGASRWASLSMRVELTLGKKTDRQTDRRSPDWYMTLAASIIIFVGCCCAEKGLLVLKCFNFYCLFALALNCSLQHSDFKLLTVNHNIRALSICKLFVNHSSWAACLDFHKNVVDSKNVVFLKFRYISVLKK